LVSFGTLAVGVPWTLYLISYLQTHLSLNKSLYKQLVEDLDYTQKNQSKYIVDVFNKEMNNILFRHFKEYPYKIIKINFIEHIV
jgi:hypothetical protein